MEEAGTDGGGDEGWRHWAGEVDNADVRRGGRRPAEGGEGAGREDDDRRPTLGTKRVPHEEREELEGGSIRSGQRDKERAKPSLQLGLRWKKKRKNKKIIEKSRKPSNQRSSHARG
jgi:hypothetical protein